MIELRNLAYFTATCRAETLSLAAARLGISVSTLSTALKALGADLDLSLFRRSSNNLAPTADARMLMRAVEPLLVAESFARRNMSAPDGDPLRRLAVEVGFTFAIGQVSAALRQAVDLMGRERPDIFVDVQWKDEVDAPSVDAWPENTGAEDVGRVSIEFADPDRDALSGETLLHVDKWAFAFRLPAGTPAISFPDASRGPIVVPMLSPSLVEQADRYFAVHGVVGVRFLRDHPGDLPRILEEYPESVLFVPKSLITPRLGLSNVATAEPRHPLATHFVARCSRSGTETNAFVGHLAKALSDGDALAVERPTVSGRQFHYFNLIHRSRRISAVARGAGVSQPALSEQLQKLEASLGVPLFVRTGDGLVPTPKGDRFAVLASLVDAGLRRLSARRTQRGPLLARRIGVGILPSVNEHGFLVSRVADAIVEVQQRFPNLAFTAQEAPNGTLQDWVMNGLVNVAVVETALPHMPRLALGSSEALSAVSHSRHRLFPQGPVRLVDLAATKLILPTTRSGLRHLLDEAARAQDIRLRPFMEINGLSMAVSLLARIPACTVLPASAVSRQLETGELSARPIVEPTISRRLYLIYSGERSLSDAERALVNALRKALSTGPMDDFERKHWTGPES